LVQTTLKAVDYFLWIYKLPFKTANFVMLHTHRHGSALQTSLFLNLVNLEEKLMQGKNISDIKLNMPRSRKMSRSRPINVSVSVSDPRLNVSVSVSIS